MRRFLHRKGQQAKPGIPPVPSGGHSPSRLRSTGPQATSGQIAPSPITGRVRAPALRSRSMSVLSYGPEADNSNRNKRFTRSLSFCDNNQIDTSSNCTRKLLTQSEEDEVFRTYTRKLYAMFAALCAIITGFIIYAYMYNTGSNRT